MFFGLSYFSAAVEKLCADFWSWRVQGSPEFATFCGVHEFDDQLDDTSVQAYEKRGVGDLSLSGSHNLIMQ